MSEQNQLLDEDVTILKYPIRMFTRIIPVTLSNYSVLNRLNIPISLVSMVCRNSLPLLPTNWRMTCILVCSV